MTGEQDTFQKHYKKLNGAQREAVDTIQGPVLVLAGPGSGKTEILSVRAANILKKTDAYASDILCLTFTESAEINMRTRLSDIIGSEANYVKVHTFHNFCRRIRNQHPEYFGVTTDFSVADDIVRTEILESIFVDMDHDNPLRSEHPELGFIYLQPAMQAIGDIKQAGINPNEFQGILDANQEFINAVRADVDAVFSQRVSKSIFADVADLIDTFEQKEITVPVPHFRSLAYALSSRLTRALEQAKDQDSTKPITEAKQDLTIKDGDARRLKTDRDTGKLQALADIYEKYESEKHRRGFYDFDDMILEVIETLEAEPELRSEIAENNRYIMVDEFQDTNDAQLRLLQALAETHPDNRPNMMAVGDDDQAIYRFQGAEVSNILNFKQGFDDVTVVTLTKNYRSAQKLLDTAHAVINQSEERLSAVIAEAEKKLEAQVARDEVAVTQYELPTRTHHNHAVADRCRELIDQGVEPSEIAVIGRRHKDLEALVPYFHEINVPITYERQQNVLEQPHIRQLITMCRFVHHFIKGEHEMAESKLPKILSFPFWGLERKQVWELSVVADEEDKPWLSVMDEKGGRLAEIADFLRSVASQATYEPVEHILDTLVGAYEQPLADRVEDSGESHAVSSGEDEGLDPELEGSNPSGSTDHMRSPFKEYYFPQEKLAEDPAEYLRFLSSLKTFVFSLREHKEQTVLQVDDLIDFVDTHKDNDLVVTDTSPFVNSQDAVNLMTAHKAKGQEFAAVVIIGAVDDIWADSRSRNRIRFPENLPIQFSGDTVDDQLRLLYVAMTRAKRTLDIMHFAVDDNGSEQVPLSFLADLDITTKKPDQDLPSTEALLESTVPAEHVSPYIEDEKALLKPLVEDYRLSVTHLNNFIDVRYGGPENFLTSNLLRFPQPMSRAQVYGRAVHETLERIYTYRKQGDELPHEDTILSWFTEQIETARISQQDREYLLARGTDALHTFLDQRLDNFRSHHISEFNFAAENVVVDDVPITGKIDKLVPEDDEVTVHDFKTGKPLTKWSSYSTKSQNYNRQLIFYKLLVENSAEFKNQTVNTGVLEFVEPKDGEVVTLDYEVTEDDVDKLKNLIQAVYNHITNLEFPDVSAYDETAKGVRNFVDDLLEGNIKG